MRLFLLASMIAAAIVVASSAPDDFLDSAGKDEKMTKEEFIKYLKKNNLHIEKDVDLSTAFVAADKDRSGIVSRKEFEAMLKRDEKPQASMIWNFIVAIISFFFVPTWLLHVYINSRNYSPNVVAIACLVTFFLPFHLLALIGCAFGSSYEDSMEGLAALLQGLAALLRLLYFLFGGT